MGWMVVGPALAGMAALVLEAYAGAAAPPPCAPPLHVGLDAYRSWDKLPDLELGDRSRSQSSADPGGSNKVVQTLPTYPNGEQVLADDTGPGVMTFMRMQSAAGGPWKLYLGSQAPTTVASSDLGKSGPVTSPATSLPYPLSLNSSESQGSGIIGGAIPFGQSLTWTAAGHHGNFYSIERRLPSGTPIPTWSTSTSAGDAATELNRAGTDIAPTDIPTQSGSADLSPGKETTVANLSGGPSELRAIQVRVPPAEMVAAGNSRVRIYWDGETTPSVDAPLKFLVGDGAGVYQPRSRPLVAGFLAGAGGDGSTFMDFNLYYPMPFHSSARITFTSPSSAAVDKLGWRVRYQRPFSDPGSWWGTFHATYTSVPQPVPGQDMSFLDVAGSGRVVGTVVNFNKVGGTLEGNPTFFIDGSNTPQVQATGTEEWGLGGNYWNGGNQTTLPLGGLPSSTNNPAGSDIDGAAEYRFLVADSVPFNNHLTLRWQHGGTDDSTQPYRAAVLWYGTPTQSAPLTDEVRVGDPVSAASHRYSAPGASPSTLTAAYGYQVEAPSSVDTGDSTTGTTSFIMALNPANAGAFLRRKSDYGLPNQRANVFLDGVFAGTWYASGSFTGTDTSGIPRRWRDDELPLPASLTAGRSSVKVQIQFVRTPADQAWSEFDYRMYSFVAPGCASTSAPAGPKAPLSCAPASCAPASSAAPATPAGGVPQALGVAPGRPAASRQPNHVKTVALIAGAVVTCAVGAVLGSRLRRRVHSP
jgi:hypothetical protein